MLIYPAIDLLEGACVRLHRGSFCRVTEFSRDPAAVARRFLRAGAPALHLVDLEGAREGAPANEDIIVAIRRLARVPLQVGGGLRSETDVSRYLEAGIDRVILGTGAIRRPQWLGRLVSRFGPDRIVAGVDVRSGRAVVEGWRAESEQSLSDVLDELGERRVERIVYTDTSRDGTLTGPDLEGARRVAERGFKTVVSGGISAAGQLRTLRRMGMAGAVIGSAFYRGALTLEEALGASGSAAGSDAAPSPFARPERTGPC